MKYAYDGQTRRITKQVLSGSQPGTTHFYYNESWKCIEERQGSATAASQQYVFGARGRNDLIFRDQISPVFARHYALCDNMGSKVAITDIGGSVQERYAFTAFGDLESVMASDYTPRPASLYHWETLFHGEFRDVETGYYNYGFRYYLSQLGRWLSRDPIGEEGGIDLYAFVENNANNYSDVLGLWAPYPGMITDPNVTPPPPGKPKKGTVSPQGNCPDGQVKDNTKMNDCGKSANKKMDKAKREFKLAAQGVAAALLYTDMKDWNNAQKLSINAISAATALNLLGSRYLDNIATANDDYDDCVNAAPCVCSE